MDEVRIVDVSARKPDGRFSVGSGYLLGPGLVLTARHVVVGDDGRTYTDQSVRRLAGPEPRTCELRWAGGGRTDVALLRVTSGEPFDLPAGGVRWGRFATNRRAGGCAAAGFPRAMRQPDGLRDLELLDGEITPATGTLRGRLYLDVRSAVPDSMEWGGLSGAAVVCRDLLVGVVVEAPDAFRGSRLAVEPITEFADLPEFREAAGLTPAIEAVELAEPRRYVVAESPADLLRAEEATVGFRPRPELDDLLAWCDDQPGLSVRLLTGPGGQGKTRLARELLAGVPGTWSAAEVGDEAPDLTGLRTPVLLVVDYAEGKAALVTTLVRQGLTQQANVAIRVLLIARSAGEWLRSNDAGVDGVLRNAVVEELAALDEGTAAREQAYADALAGLAVRLRRLGWQPPELGQVFVPDLSDARFGSPLTLQMTALAALLEPAGDEGRPPEEVILRHEERYWRHVAEGVGLDLAGETLRRTVAVASACGATDQAEALGVLASLRGVRDQTEDVRERVARWHHGLYPPSSPHRGTGPYWGSLQPDRLAEYLVASVIAEDLELLPAVLSATSETQDEQALTVLTRAAEDHQLAVEQLEPLLSRLLKLAPTAVRVAIQARQPDPVVTALTASIADADLATLDAIHDALPAGSDVLGRFAVQVEERRTAYGAALTRRDPATWAIRLADASNDLSVRLDHVGDRARALTAAEGAVRFYQLYPDRPGTADGLIRAYSNLSNQLSEVGRHEEALDAIERAIALYSGQAESEQDTGTLVSLYNNKSNRLGSLGRHEEALDAIRTSVALADRLPAETLDALSSRGTALINLSSRLYSTQRYDEAVDAAANAVDTFRRLVAVSADGWLPNLAKALNNLAVLQNTTGQREASVDSFVEAGGIYQDLAPRNPDARLPELASVFTNLGMVMGELGRHEDGLACAGHALDILGPLAARLPARFEPELAKSLTALGIQLIDAGRPVEAVRPLVDAMQYAVQSNREDLRKAAYAFVQSAHQADPEAVQAEIERILATQPRAPG